MGRYAINCIDKIIIRKEAEIKGLHQNNDSAIHDFFFLFFFSCAVLAFNVKAGEGTNDGDIGSDGEF